MFVTFVDFDRFLLYNTLGKKPNLHPVTSVSLRHKMSSPVNEPFADPQSKGLAPAVGLLLIVIIVGSSSFFLGTQFETLRARRAARTPLNANTVTNDVKDEVYQFSGKIIEMKDGSLVVESDSLGKTLTVAVTEETAYSQATILPSDNQTLTVSGLKAGDAIRVDSENDASANATVRATHIKRLLQ